MTLSIIIVNYNVKYFLEQCLCSVKKAIEKIEAVVIVIDNHSSDGSIDYLKPKFPWAHYVINTKNDGFAKANNRALLQAKSKYVLFLNPDTIVAEDSFETCISFMEDHPEAGALGVKMIDGRGNYLKESKRGFPSPWAAFCKLSGITGMFPHSTFFSEYYLGHLSEKENQIIDVISGAFMFVRKDVLDRTGAFDERFFMYAEDIDLSYRIQQAGYINYYLANTTIIHFKGESTKKDYQYVKLFYKAMSLFVQKHFSKKFVLFTLIIKPAIWLHRLLSASKNLFPKKQANKHTDKLKLFLTGDLESKKKLKILLSADKRIILEKEKEAADVIFCEGKKLSFKKIITFIQNPSKKYNYKFHSGDSGSIVSSNEKNVSGEAFGLYP